MGIIKNVFFGTIIGIVNALFGAGGGTIAVPLIKSEGKSQKEAQASSVAVILPLCLLTAVVYYFKGYYEIKAALPYIPFSFLGAILGSAVFKKIPEKILKKAFALFMAYLGIRMLLK